MTEDSKSVDIFGVKPIADAALVVTKGAVDGAGAFLSRICLPAAEEFGLLLKDHVSAFRQRNALAMLAKAEALTSSREAAGRVQAKPRLVITAIENASWSDDDEIQSAWAGLLASSCSEEGGKEDNLIFMDLLSRLTGPQVRILETAVEAAQKFCTPAGFVLAFPVILPFGALVERTGETNRHTLDFFLDHVCEMGLTTPGSGFHPQNGEAILQPSPLGISLYVRSQGFVGPPAEYFGDLPERDPNGDDVAIEADQIRRKWDQSSAAAAGPTPQSAHR